jgi:hypothetical protein
VTVTVYCPPQSLQGLNRRGQASRFDVIVECLFQTLEACGMFGDGTDICLQDDGLRRGRADHCREPSERGRAPIGPAHGADSGSEQERFEAKLGVCEIAAGLCTIPAEVTHGCVFHLGDRDRGEIA